MLLRCQRRKTDGKVHEYWSIVESRRLGDGREVQRRQVAMFPASAMPRDDVNAFGVCLSQLRLERPRQWGACWLAMQLWRQLELDAIWHPCLRPSREGTPRLNLQTEVEHARMGFDTVSWQGATTLRAELWKDPREEEWSRTDPFAIHTA